MRKGDLVAAITARQVGGNNGASGSPAPAPRTPDETGSADNARGVAASAPPPEAPISGGAHGGPLTQAPPPRSRRGASRPAGSPSGEDAAAATSAPAETEQRGTEQR